MPQRVTKLLLPTFLLLAATACGFRGAATSADSAADATGLSSSFTPPGGATVVSNTSQSLAAVMSSTKNVALHPAADTSLCLDVQGAVDADGTPVQLYSCNGSLAQQWTYDGRYMRIFADKCLNVVGGTDADGVRLQIWSCDPSKTSNINNTWQVVGGTLRWMNDLQKCLDVTDGGASSGTPAQIMTCTANKQNQQWVVNTGGTGGVQNTASSTSSPEVAAGGVVALHPGGNSALCLDVVGGQNADGTAVQLYGCNGTAAQQWRQSGSFWQVFGDKCLNVKDGVDNNGTRLQIWTCDPATSTDKNNAWQSSGGTLRWQGNAARCLDVPASNFQPEVPVQIWSCNGGSNQQWTPDGTVVATTPTPSNSGASGTVPSSSGKFSLGAIIDFDGLGPHGKQSVQSFIQATKVVPDVVDSYVQMKKDGSFELSTAKTLISQAAAGKVSRVCLSVTSQVQGKLSANQLSQLVEAINYAKGSGITVEVRFGYEMNGYWSPSNVTNGAANNPANFLSQWAQVAPVVHGAGGLMFWSPNIPFDNNSALARWLPSDASSIDLVGIDYYPKANPLTVDTVRTALASVYPIAQKLNKPVLFGESAYAPTGSSYQENATEAQAKVKWLAALSDPTLRAQYPLYRGFRWFDYQKYENNTNNNFSISADSYAASAFSAWYSSSFAR